VKKLSAICIHFCILIACQMSDKIFNSGSTIFDKFFGMIFFKVFILNYAQYNIKIDPKSYTFFYRNLQFFIEIYCILPDNCMVKYVFSHAF
jgi:hypothetical protein